MTRATTTPSEALAQLIAECKLLDASEVGERWNQFNGAIAVAEMVLRDDKESEIWHVQKLRDAAADPMLYAHAEVSKSLLLGAANIIEAASARIAKLKSASQDPYAYAYECCQPGTDGKGWAQFINRKPVTPKDGVRNVIPLYTAPAASQPAAAPASVTQTLRDIGELLRTQDNRATDQPMFIVQQKRLYVTAEDYNDYRIEWHESERGDYQPASPLRAARLEVLHRGCREYPGWTRLAVHDVWEFVTACVTEQGCKDYIARNGHNLNEPRIYAEGSYRNEEFHAIRNWLMSLAAAPLHESGSAAAVQEPIGEVAARGRFISNVDWFTGYMPPIGTKLYTAPVAAPSIAAPTEVERDAARYKEVRTWSARKFTDIWELNIAGKGAFDGFVDVAIATGENNG